jgi:hypothetical protein
LTFSRSGVILQIRCCSNYPPRMPDCLTGACTRRRLPDHEAPLVMRER